MEARADHMGVLVPRRPAGHGMMEEHHALACSQERSKSCDVVRWGSQQIDGGLRPRERDPWHVVHHEDVEVGGPRRLHQVQCSGVLDVCPVEVTDRVEHCEKCRLIERMATRHDSDAQAVHSGTFSVGEGDDNGIWFRRVSKVR